MRLSLNVIIIALLVLSMCNIVLVDIFTFRIRADRGISGNGNPGIIFVIAFIPAYIGLLIAILVKCTKQISRKAVYWLTGCGVIGIVIFSLSLIRFVARKYNTFADHLDGFGVLNQYTNTVFINFHSFLLTLSMWIVVIGIVRLMRTSKK